MECLRDDSGCLAHESLQPLLSSSSGKYLDKRGPRLLLLFSSSFFFKPEPAGTELVPLQTPGLCAAALRPSLSPCREEALAPPPPVAAKNTQALSVCFNPSRKKRGGSCQRNPDPDPDPDLCFCTLLNFFPFAIDCQRLFLSREARCGKQCF